MSGYDAIVVGARCAGSPTAMLLARRGHRVLLVDRASFPSDTISTHNILHRGLVQLQAWGLYERIAATGCPELNKRTRYDGDFPLIGYAAKSAEGIPSSMCPRRTVLDKILVDAAVEAGAELRDGFSVRDLLFDSDRVVGLVGTTRSGGRHVERAGLVIGADGRNSYVASAVRAPKYREVPPVLCWYYTYWPGVQDLGHAVASRSNRKLIFLPTNDGLTCVLIGWPPSELGRVRANVEAEYRAALRVLAPPIAERLEGVAPTERFYGLADVPNFFRRPYGPGWALVGDAGYHKDPMGAHGISDAVRDADILADEVHAALVGEKPMDRALGEYERRRNDAAFPLYEQNLRLASFDPPPPDELRVRAALRDASQEDIDAYMSAIYGTKRRESFYNPANLARLFRAAEGMEASSAEQAS